MPRGHTLRSAKKMEISHNEMDDNIKSSQLVTQEVYNHGQDWSGIPYIDPDAIGANPTAKIYPDGTIIGSTDNGRYTKYPNGMLEVSIEGSFKFDTDLVQSYATPLISNVPFHYISFSLKNINAVSDDVASTVFIRDYDEMNQITLQTRNMASAVAVVKISARGAY